MARVKFHHSLSRAQKVLKAANAIGFSKKAAGLFYAQSWDNCREQGLVLKALILMKDPAHETKRLLKTPAVFFAESRNSDSTVVVIDEDIGPHIQSVPSDAGWKKGRNFFSADDIQGAAKAIVKAVNDFAKLEVEN